MKGVYVSVLKYQTNLYHLAHSSYFQMSIIKGEGEKKKIERKKQTNKNEGWGGEMTNALL